MRRIRPKTISSRLIPTSNKHIRAAKPRLETKVKGSTARYKSR